MLTTTVPVNYEAEARERLDQIGYHQAFEQILEHITQTIPNLQRIEVTAPYNEMLGPEQQVVIEAFTTDSSWLDLYRKFDEWVIANIPGEQGMHFCLLLVDG
jgi:hypothetical protein